jgi:membrane-associated phospholipid phosphatase
MTTVAAASALAITLAAAVSATAQDDSNGTNQVLEWNQIFVDTLIATNTANSSSQRLGAIVHTAIFDAFNGIERRYTPIFVHPAAHQGASRRAAVIAAAYTTLASLFPTRQSILADLYARSLANLSNDGHGGQARERGIAWGTQVAQAALTWRATDGFSANYDPFTGGTAIGQWRPVPPATGMSAQGLAFTTPFAVTSSIQFQPNPPRGLSHPDYLVDFDTVKALGRRTGSSRTEAQTALAPFWEGNASVHWNQAANQIARANDLSVSAANRLLAVLNVAMADTAITTWAAKRFFGAVAGEVTWRPVTAITIPDDGLFATEQDSSWLPLVNTPSHPEYPAGHPSLNGAAATVLLSYFADSQSFTLTTPGLESRTYSSITQARQDGNNARVWGGMHFPSTVDASDTNGAEIAAWVNRNAMQRQDHE